MRTLYKWRVTDPISGRKYITRHYSTEEDIRREHPEAECMTSLFITVSPLYDTNEVGSGMCPLQGEGSLGK